MVTWWRCCCPTKAQMHDPPDYAASAVDRTGARSPPPPYTQGRCTPAPPYGGDDDDDDVPLVMDHGVYADAVRQSPVAALHAERLEMLRRLAVPLPILIEAMNAVVEYDAYFATENYAACEAAAEQMRPLCAAAGYRWGGPPPAVRCAAGDVVRSMTGKMVPGAYTPDLDRLDHLLKEYDNAVRHGKWDRREAVAAELLPLVRDGGYEGLPCAALVREYGGGVRRLAIA